MHQENFLSLFQKSLYFPHKCLSPLIQITFRNDVEKGKRIPIYNPILKLGNDGERRNVFNGELLSFFIVFQLISPQSDKKKLNDTLMQLV